MLVPPFAVGVETKTGRGFEEINQALKILAEKGTVQ